MTNKQAVLNTAAFSTTSPININGKPATRLMVVYRTVGCQYGQCTMCDFNHYADKNITAENIKQQHKYSLKELKQGKYAHFDLLTLGNFFNNQEISADLRKYLLTTLSKIKTLKRVLVEARRGFLTLHELKKCKSYLRSDQILEFALGYESSNPYVRNTILNKSVPEKHLDDSLSICKDAGVDFVSYVLIKPHLLSETDSIRDTVDTALHVLTTAKKYGVNARLAFEPVFVTYDTPIEEHWKRGEYEPLQFWTIAEIMIKIAEKLDVKNTTGKLFIGLSDENLSSERFSHNCGVCDVNIKNELQEFNGHQDINKLKELYHGCKDHWKKMLSGGEKIEEYVDASVFLGMHNIDDKIRIACKNYFVQRLKTNKTIGMSLEQMGKCTDTIWHCSELEQGQYYPFMDKLNTELKIRQSSYNEKDIQMSETSHMLKDLRIIDRLKVGMVLNRGGVIYTVNPYLLTRKGLPIKTPGFGKELSFPIELEQLYQTSLKVRICTKE